MNTGSLLVNVLSLLTTSWGLYNAAEVKLPASLAQAGHKQFLTNISVGITILTNLTSIFTYYTNGKLEVFSREIAFPVALVLETIVALVYWPLRLFALHLIFHGVADDAHAPLKMSIDLSIHLLPVLYLLADYFAFTDKPFQMPRRNVWFIVMALGLLYNRYLKFLIDPSKGQAYPYPFLNIPEPFQSVVFTVVTTSGWGFYCFYKYVHHETKRGLKLKQA